MILRFKMIYYIISVIDVKVDICYLFMWLWIKLTLYDIALRSIRYYKDSNKIISLVFGRRFIYKINKEGMLEID